MSRAERRASKCSVDTPVFSSLRQPSFAPFTIALMGAGTRKSHFAKHESFPTLSCCSEMRSSGRPRAASVSARSIVRPRQRRSPLGPKMHSKCSR
eukprot:4100334-Prymnesium_polylepis.1